MKFTVIDIGDGRVINPRFVLKDKYRFLLLFVLFSVVQLFHSVSGQDARFTVVIDAGHGGHDSGAKGAYSYEKNINLNISLKLGELIEKHFTDREVKLVYTRQTDRYLTLQERADVVNSNHADLFVCVHTNSSPSASPYGAETYTLGLAKTKSNLDVAMRENAVITLEENYKTKYQGFDPKSIDSYIMFEFMQDKYIDRSVNFASSVQKQFQRSCNRLDRGVRQAGFWVLHRSACPSVLIEVGFISNPDEERYLNSKYGETQMASAIFNAIVDYKRDHDKKSGRSISTVDKINFSEIKIDSSEESSPANRPIAEAVDTNIKTAPVNNVPRNVVVSSRLSKPLTASNSVELQLPVYRLQFLAAVNSYPAGSPHFKGLSNVYTYQEGREYKFMVGRSTNFDDIEKLRLQLKSKFPEAFVVAFVGNKRISVREALKIKNK